MNARKLAPSLYTLREAPVVGKFYRVPAILHVYPNWYSSEMFWPIIGPLHHDAEFFNLPNPHYHIDLRFISARHRAVAKPYAGKLGVNASFLARPLSARQLSAKGEFETLPRPVLVRMRCTGNTIFYPHAHRDPICALNTHYAGTRCERGRQGWICPHRAAPIGTHLPDEDGVITCPLHGLRIDAATGVCLGPKGEQP